MWDFVKKSLAFSLGAAMLTGEKLREFADEAVARGEMSKEEAKKFIDDVSQRGEEEKRNLQTWIREQVAKVMRDAGAVEASRVDALEQRIQALEAKLSISSEHSQETVS